MFGNSSREWHCVNMLLKLADNAELAAHNPGSSQCMAIAKCGKDIRSHLSLFWTLVFADSTVKTEAGLSSLPGQVMH